MWTLLHKLLFREQFLRDWSSDKANIDYIYSSIYISFLSDAFPETRSGVYFSLIVARLATPANDFTWQIWNPWKARVYSAATTRTRRHILYREKAKSNFSETDPFAGIYFSWDCRCRLNPGEIPWRSRSACLRGRPFQKALSLSLTLRDPLYLASQPGSWTPRVYTCSCRCTMGESWQLVFFAPLNFKLDWLRFCKSIALELCRCARTTASISPPDRCASK